MKRFIILSLFALTSCGQTATQVAEPTTITTTTTTTTTTTSQPTVVSDSVARVSPSTLPELTPTGRIVLIGDSVTWLLCQHMSDAECFASPGGWVDNGAGVNLLNEFITQANIQPGDKVVISSASSFHSIQSPDDAAIRLRLLSSLDRIVSLGADLVTLIPTNTGGLGYPNCVQPMTEAALLTFGVNDVAESCATQAAVAEVMDAYPAARVEVYGPFESDLIHPSPVGLENLARDVRNIY